MIARLLVVAICAVQLHAATPAARIRALLDSSAVARASFWGVQIVDLGDGRVWFERNSNRAFLPASNAKLFSTALALTRLGPDYRFQTRVVAGRPADENGCVDSLRIVGGGDPNLSGREIPYRMGADSGDPLAAIGDLASQVAARGVHCVSGDVIGDDTAYVWEPYPEGWALDDAAWDYGAAVSALSINDNVLTLRLLPADQENAPARMTLSPDVDYYQIDNRVRTAPGERKVSIDRLPGSRSLAIWGTIPPGDPGDTERLGIDDPALYAATVLRDALMRHGVAVRGTVRSRHLFPGQAAEPDDPGVELARRASAPLLEDLRITAKVSQNLHAEMALLAVAKARRQTGSREAGLAEMQTFLTEAGIARESYNLVDGSGLSRLDLVTPTAVVRLLEFMYRSPFREQWLSVLPVAGADGTLHARMAGTSAAGRIYAKTGTLSHVSALSGYARRRDGRILAFSVLVNNYNVPANGVTAVIDRLCALVME